MSHSFDERRPGGADGGGAKATVSLDLEERREHRRRPRTVYEVEAKMEVAGATKRGGGLMVRTRDVSEIGAAVRCPESVATGSPVRLSIVVPSGAALNLRGSVVRLNPLQEGLYELGIRFAEEQPQLSAWRVEMTLRGR